MKKCSNEKCGGVTIPYTDARSSWLEVGRRHVKFDYTSSGVDCTKCGHRKNTACDNQEIMIAALNEFWSAELAKSGLSPEQISDVRAVLCRTFSRLGRRDSVGSMFVYWVRNLVKCSR